MQHAHVTTTLVLIGVLSAALILRKLREPLHEIQRIRISTRDRFTRPAATFVQHIMDGTKRPAGVPMKAFMYDCFRHDVARGKLAENPRIPRHDGFLAGAAPSQRLRLVSFNVHFFQMGYSGVELGDSRVPVLALIAELHPDLMLLQEVPQSVLPDVTARLAAIGFPHCVAAGSADAHVLDKKLKSFPGERLHVVLASRLPLLSSEAVPMLDGHAAFAEVDLSAAATPNARRRLLVYTLHLSVRCEASKRREEVEAVLHDAAGRAAADAPMIVCGDFNQPNECDYPEAEWAAIAKDMSFAKLPLTDGAMDAMRKRSFAPSWEVAETPRPLAASSAWNGAVVDYCYTRLPAHSAMAVEATYMYHTELSDHLPLVVDLRV